MQQPPLNRSRNDKFVLVLDIPQALKNKYDSTSEDFFNIESLQMAVYGSPIPQITVPAISVPYGGQVYKATSASRPEYNPLTIRFLVDNGYKNYWLLWNWLNLLNDSKTSKSEQNTIPDFSINDSKKDIRIINPMSDYVSRFSIYGMDEYNNKIISFEYSHAFPTNLSELNFSNQDPSEINCTVTFAFNQLQVELVKNVNDTNC